MYYIYQRISCEKQSLIRQEGETERYCKDNNIVVPEENIYKDIITGKTIKRENYQKMKAKIGKGDFLIILDLDRLGRTWDIIKNEWKELTDKGVYIIVINCPVINVMPDTDGNISLDKRLIQTIMFNLLCYLSQKEVEKISKRTKEALRAKKEQGIKLGCPCSISEEKVAEVLRLKEQGLTYAEISKATGVSKGSISRFCNRGRE